MNNILPAASKTYTILTVCLLSIPMVAYYFIFVTYAVNIPYWDDYDAVLVFLTNFINAESILEKISLIFSQHNEHRIVFDKLIFLISYYVFGSVNFEWLTIVGNSSLIILLLVILMAFLQNKPVSILYFIPVAYLLFHPLFFENSNWAMASLQNFYVLSFSFISLYLLAKPTTNAFITACIFACIATFTSGNGMFVFLVGIFSLVVQKRFTPHLIIWLILTFFAISLYFYGYVRPGHHPDIFLTVKQHPGIVISYYLLFVSSMFKVFSQLGQGGYIILGSVITLLFIYLTFTQYFKKNLAVFSFLLFLFSSAAAASLSRAGLGLEGAIASRYTINSALIVILLYISFIELFSKRLNIYLIVIFFLLSAGFTLSTYPVSIQHIAGHRQRLVTTGALYKDLNDFSLLPYANTFTAKMILTQASKAGIYKIPEINLYEPSRQISLSVADSTGTNNIDYDFNLVNTRKFYVVSNGKALLKEKGTPEYGIYILLKSGQNQYIFNTKPVQANVTPKFIADSNISANTSSHFSFALSKDSLPSGNYQVWLLLKKGNYTALQPTGHSIENQSPYEILTNLPKNEDKITHFVEVFDEGAEFVHIKGWAYLSGQGTENSQLSLVLHSDEINYLTKPKIEERTDVTDHFKNGYNLNRSGYSMFIPKSDLNPGNYQVGIYIKDDTKPAESFTFTDKSFSNNVIVPEITSKLPSPDPQAINFNVETVEDNQDYVKVSGWAFLNNKSTDNTSISVILQQNEKYYQLKSSVFLRPDVTSHFKTLNLDKSGFSVLIPKAQLEPGNYNIGISILDKETNTTYFSLSNKSVKL
jgi:hypothetical protein